MAAIRVVLADDHALVRAGIRELLAARGLVVVGEAGDGRELLHQVRAQRPDVALVDLSMPLLDGLEATRRVARFSPTTRVVILSMHDEEAFVVRARRAGAMGFVPKDAAADRLADVIARVASGECCLPDADAAGAEEPLSSRESEVLRLVIEGRKNAEIAGILCRSVHTVRSHRARLMKKLGARSGVELVEAAERLGIVPPSAVAKKAT
jgi:DNA-binding NarL/FixJ family response regulator